MKVGAHPGAPTRGYLDLNYSAPVLGQEYPSPKRSLTVQMAPPRLQGGFVGTWAAIVACVVRLDAFEDWPTLCSIMPPPFELERSAERDPQTAFPRFPHGVETRCSAKFDVLDMLAKIGVTPEVLRFSQWKMLDGVENDGFTFTHRPKAAK